MNDIVDYDGLEVRTVEGNMVYLEDWRIAMHYRSKDEIICLSDTTEEAEEEWEKIEEEFEEWCDEYDVQGETV